MKIGKLALAVFFLILLIFLTGCQEEKKSARLEDLLENIQKESRIFKPAFPQPEAKTAELSNYFNQKWQGKVYVAGRYEFNPQFKTDKVTFIVFFYGQEVQPSFIDEVTGDIAWNAAREMQALITEIIHEKPDGATDIYRFASNSAKLGEDIPQNWRNYISEQYLGTVYFFPSDEPGFYKVIGSIKDERLKKKVDDWNEAWAGRVRLNASDLLSETKQIKKIKYRILLGFKLPTQGENALYIQQINNTLGEIVYESYKDFSPEDFLMFVCFPDGSRYVYYPISGKIAEFQALISTQPKEKAISDWSGYFVVKPYLLSASKVGKIDGE